LEGIDYKKLETICDSKIGSPDSIEERDRTAVHEAVKSLICFIDEDPDREGLLATPDRFVRMLIEVTEGYRVDPISLINNALFDVEYDEMVVVKDIDFHSLCEHHMLPFFGKAHVAYIPREKVIGLSKIPRIVEMFARRLQVQERLTVQIADFLQEVLHPYGVGVVVEGSHMCMTMRGIKKANAFMKTSHLLGIFRTDGKTRNEFMNHINANSGSI
jgi:GTP cyclohydrolase I